MAISVYLSTTEPTSGKSLVALGILDLVLKKTNRIGYFRPIIQDAVEGKPDKNIELMLEHFKLRQAYEASFGLYHQNCADLAAQGKTDRIFDIVIAKYKALESECDFILCEGSDYLGEDRAFEFHLNTAIAKNLNCPILLLGNGEDNTLEEILHPIDLAIQAYESQSCQVIGVILNKIKPELTESVASTLKKHYHRHKFFLAVLPYEPLLSWPRLSQIATKLGAEVLAGEEYLNNLVGHYAIMAMYIGNSLEWFSEEDTLIITPGDRGDIILGVIQAHQSFNYPRVAGLLLTADCRPQETILRLIEGLPQTPPILLVKTNTYETIHKLDHIRSSLTPDDAEKIAASIRLFQTHIDLARVEERLKNLVVKGVTPKLFVYNLVQTAKAKKRHIVLPEGHEPRILRAAAALIEQDIVELTLLGSQDTIQQIIYQHQINFDLNRVKIVNPTESERYEHYAQTLYQLRQGKGMNLDSARDNLADISYYGTMMVYLGDADGMVSGSVNTTQHTVRPALQIIKTKPGFSLVSSVFFMCLDDRVLVYGDCAVNPDPTAEQLAEIAITSAETAQQFGIEPKVALLSYSSGDSGRGEEVEKVRRATQIAQRRSPHLCLEGPIQYDAAVDPEVGAQKMPGSSVAGQATVFIFPDLNTGNNTYKAVQRETQAIAIGPLLQGLRKPVNDLSRGCTVEDIINTVVITAIQSQSTKG